MEGNADEYDRLASTSGKQVVWESKFGEKRVK